MATTTTRHPAALQHFVTETGPTTATHPATTATVTHSARRQQLQQWRFSAPKNLFKHQDFAYNCFTGRGMGFNEISFNLLTGNMQQYTEFNPEGWK
ncbi:hypothetical protein PHAVU_001G110601 [Phaseolus vulgaris]